MDPWPDPGRFSSALISFRASPLLFDRLVETELSHKAYSLFCFDLHQLCGWSLGEAYLYNKVGPVEPYEEWLQCLRVFSLEKKVPEWGHDWNYTKLHMGWMKWTEQCCCFFQSALQIRDSQPAFQEIGILESAAADSSPFLKSMDFMPHCGQSCKVVCACAHTCAYVWEHFAEIISATARPGSSWESQLAYLKHLSRCDMWWVVNAFVHLRASQHVVSGKM